jgi:chromosome partitioning protein
MNIISLINGKGGCGKSTLAIHIARCLQLNKAGSVLLVDADPQGTIRDWNASRETDKHKMPVVVGIDKGDLKKDVVALGTNYDWTVIDTSGQVEGQAASALRISDLVIIPVQPSPNDFWAANSVVQTVKDRQEIADGKPIAAFSLNRVKKGTKLKNQADSVEEYGLPLFNGYVHDRTGFPLALADGLTIFEFDGKGQAAWEINHLTKQIIEAFES